MCSVLCVMHISCHERKREREENILYKFNTSNNNNIAIEEYLSAVIIIEDSLITNFFSFLDYIQHNILVFQFAIAIAMQKITFFNIRYFNKI